MLDIETSGLSPETNRITCVGCYCEAGVLIFSGKDEKSLLEDFFLFLASIPDPLIVSFNGKHFDVPFIVKRVELIGALALVDLNSVRHVDLMQVIYPAYKVLFGPTSTGRVSKDAISDLLNIYEPRASSAKSCVLIAELESDWTPILQHNALDLFTTFKIFKKAVEYGWVHD